LAIHQNSSIPQGLFGRSHNERIVYYQTFYKGFLIKTVVLLTVLKVIYFDEYLNALKQYNSAQIALLAYINVQYKRVLLLV
jgi:hypothetical protein